MVRRRHPRSGELDRLIRHSPSAGIFRSPDLAVRATAKSMGPPGSGRQREVLPQRGHGLRPPSRRRLAWGSTMAIVAPSGGLLKHPVCRGHTTGSGGPCPLGAAMDSSGFARCCRSPQPGRRGSCWRLRRPRRPAPGAGLRRRHENRQRAATLRPRAIVSPAFQLGTALASVGGSAGTPSVVSSLNRNPAIRSSYPPGAERRNERIADALLVASPAREPPDERTEH